LSTIFLKENVVDNRLLQNVADLNEEEVLSQIRKDLGVDTGPASCPTLRSCKAKCILELDGATDAFKSKEVLSGHMCIMGDVPATLFKLDTPEQAMAYIKRLIYEVSSDDGFVLSTGCDTPA
jgi:uroporphyrinogen-III decarboxylase